MSKMRGSHREGKAENLSSGNTLRYSRSAALVFLFILLIIIDQISKILVIRRFDKIVLYNSGGAFSILAGSNIYWVAFLIAIVALAFIFYKTISKKNLWIPYILIFAGVISNTIDRFYRGSVVDYINLKYWPSFNIADIFITVGLIWLAINLLVPSRK